VFVGAVMEHIEEAGVHSGDSSCQIPPATLSEEELDEVESIARTLARSLGVVGLINLQLAVKDERIWVLEANPRASRTVPFVSKAIGVPLAKVATAVLLGATLAQLEAEGVVPGDPRHYRRVPYTAVKAAVLPFGRFPGVDTVLGPEMRSTGEVIGLDTSFDAAFVKSQLGGGTKAPREGVVFVSVRDADKPRILPAIRDLKEIGFSVVATGGTARFLQEQGIAAQKINKVSEGRPHIVDAIKNGGIQLVFNTTEGAQALADSRSLRRAALLHKVPYYTTLAGAVAAAQGVRAYVSGDLEARALQDYFVPARD
jgi:carbamoyl-phosphate synthase large subunit